ncbi:MAG TPA: zinc ribbon domain-containing protein [Polyangiaceae bacterium]|nr:zinc ribbon domain-containing protein [Polyangiaceae bacterium]
MFCPNCGTQNPDAAQTCSKCNFHLKSVAAPKFKGTMLMMNQPGPMPGPTPAPAAPAPFAPTPAPAAAVPPGARPAGPAPGGPSVPSKLKGTMVGVAPMAGPSRGGPGPVAVPPAGAPAGPTPFPPAPSPADAGSAYSPPVPQPGVNPLGGTLAADASSFAAGFGAGGNAGQPPFGQSGQGMGGQGMGGQGMGGHSPGHALGGTALMPAAGGGSPGFGGGYNPPAGAATQLQYGIPQGQPPYGAPQGGYGAQPPQGGLPYGGQGPTHGAPQAGGASYGAPPPGSPYGGAPQGGSPAPYGSGAGGGYGGGPAYDATAAGASYGSPSSVPPPNPFTAPSTFGSGPSAQAGYGTPGPSQGIAPYNATSSALAGALSAGSAGPTRRNPIMTLLLPYAIMFGSVIFFSVLAAVLRVPALGLLGLVGLMAGGIWNLLQLIAMTNEVKAVTRNEAFAWWPIFVPLYQIYWMWILFPQEVGKAKQSLGIQTPVRNIVLYIFLFPFAAASDINDMAR